jgi:hypothetical protein
MDIIIRRGKPRGRTRSREDEVMRKEWGTSSFRSEEAQDKCEYLERVLKETTGADNVQVPAKLIDVVK